tara:strand:+ start:48 stop:290 length:243 start_codon:yes stop_codon:yes gene_type:complete
MINIANPVSRIVVVPNIRRDCRGGSESAIVGDKSRRLRRRMMLSIGLCRRSNDMFSAYSRLPAAETGKIKTWQCEKAGCI